MDAEPYDVRVSARRRTTLAIVREQGRLVVLVPPRMTPHQQRTMIPGLVERYLHGERRRRAPRADAALTDRARHLFRAHLSDAPAMPDFHVSWSARQRQRWGSCTTATGEIRLSQRLTTMPDWVVDYVLMHELVHLLETDHTARFHALVDRYPLTERAKGFLDGWTHAQAHGPEADGTAQD